MNKYDTMKKMFNIFCDIALVLITNGLKSSYVSNSSSLLVKRIVHRMVFLLQSINLGTKFMKYKNLEDLGSIRKCSN